MTTQKTYNFGNLEITQTIIETKGGIVKENEVTKFNGEYYEFVSPNSEDFKKAIILMHNEKING